MYSEYKNENEDINYFDMELKSLLESVSVPLIEKRMDIHKSDAMEELIEVYEEVKQIELNLSRAVEIGNFIIDKNKDLIHLNNQ